MEEQYVVQEISGYDGCACRAFRMDYDPSPLLEDLSDSLLASLSLWWCVICLEKIVEEDVVVVVVVAAVVVV